MFEAKQVSKCVNKSPTRLNYLQAGKETVFLVHKTRIFTTK